MKKQKFIQSVLVSLGLTSAAQAFNVQKFQPLLNQEGGLTLLGAHVQERRTGSLGLFLNGAKNPLEFRFTGTSTRSDSIVNWFFTSDVLGSYALTDRVSFFIDVPVHIYQNIEPVSSIAQKDQMRMGDILLQSNIILKSNSKSAVGLALVPFVTLPTGNENDFVGDSSLVKNVFATVGARAAIDSWLGKRNYVSLNAGYRARKKEQLFSFTVDDEFLASVGYAFVASPRYALDVFTEVNTSTMFRSFYKDQGNSPAEFLAGVRKSSIGGGLSGVLGGGIGVNSGYGVPDWRVFTTLQYSPQSGRASHVDGPSAPVVAAVTPVIKKMPTKLEVAIVNDKGEKAKVPFSLVDSKGETVVKNTDSNWSNELAAGVYVLSVQGEAKEPFKKMVTLKEGETTVENIQLASLTVAAVPVPKVEMRQKIDLKGKIFFDTNQATIKPESFSVLNDAVDKLKSHPEFNKIQIEAHTDALGLEDKNQTLSEARAKSVVDYLVGKGIDAKRLDAKGFGKSMPIASNKTKVGRAQNRRVEFVVVE